MNTVRLGQLAGNKNVFYGAKLNQDSTKLMSYTYNGSFYLWKRGETIRDWDNLSPITGHFAEVLFIYILQFNFLGHGHRLQQRR
jgi:hypothetical protein